MFDLDKRGLPGVMIATEAFKDAAKAQVKQLGFEPAIVWIPHPVQNRTDDELRQLVDSVYDEIVGAISADTTH